jgi:predicted amidophosphoribosyltransferase
MNFCRHCRRPLEKLLYFCGECWPKVPAQERISLYSMHAKREDTASKVAKICRILANPKTK